MNLKELNLFAGLRGDYILEPWLQRGDLVLLFAKRGLAKTFIVTKLINSLAANDDFLKWRPKRAFKSIHFSGEMGRAISADRYEAVKRGATIEPDPEKAEFLCYENMKNGKAWNLADPADQKLFKAAAKDSEVIVLDNLMTLSGIVKSGETDLETWMKIQDLLLYWRANNQTVILVHHANKTGDQSGTMQRENIMDTVVEIRKSDLKHYPNGTSIEWNFTKSRSFFGADADPFHLAIENQNGAAVFTWARLEEMQRARVLDLSIKIRQPKIIADVTGIPLLLVAKYLNEGKAVPAVTEPEAPISTEPYFAEDTADELF
jgi:putative DNA primase/helicase